MNTEPQGLINKYLIVKTDGSPVDPFAEYFVLRLDYNQKDRFHREACIKAILTYAEEIEDTQPQLAKDIRERYEII